MILKKDLWCSPSYCVYILCVFVLINVTYRQKNVFFLKKRSVVSIIPGLGLLLMICNWTSSQMDHRKYTRRGRIIFLHVNRTLTLKLVSCPTEYSSSVYNTVSICSHFVISFYIGLPACRLHKNLPFGQAAHAAVLPRNAFLPKQVAVVYHWPFLAFHDLSEHFGTEEVSATDMGRKKRTCSDRGQDHTEGVLL